jgi:hypothetical protein
MRYDSLHSNCPLRGQPGVYKTGGDLGDFQSRRRSRSRNERSARHSASRLKNGARAHKRAIDQTTLTDVHWAATQVTGKTTD